MAERRRPRSRNASSPVKTKTRPRKAAARAAKKAAKRPAAKSAAKRAVKKAVKSAAKTAAKAKTRAKPADPHAAVRRYRERMRAKGLRPMTIWAPDLTNPAVRAMLAREFAAICAAATADAAFSPLFDAQDFPDWTA